MKKRITISEVAEKAKVSIATVSRVLNDNTKVAEATRQRILQVVQELEFEPNLPARIPPKNKTRAIGVILGDISNPYFSRIAKNIEIALEKSHYTMLLTDSDFNEDKELRLTKVLLRHSVEGVLIASVNENTKAIRLLKSMSIPFIMVNCIAAESDVDWICGDNAQGGYLATKYLLDLGHPKLMHIRGRNIRTGLDRYEGFRKAIAEKGLDLADQVIIGSSDAAKDGFDIISKYIQKNGEDALSSAIFAYNDSVAIGVMEALGDHGIRVPEDVSIVGYDNIEISKLLKTPLTTIDQSQIKMGDIAATQLIDKIERKELTITRHITIKPELIVRDSCRKYNG